MEKIIFTKNDVLCAYTAAMKHRINIIESWSHQLFEDQTFFQNSSRKIYHAGLLSSEKNYGRLNFMFFFFQNNYTSEGSLPSSRTFRNNLNQISRGRRVCARIKESKLQRYLARQNVAPRLASQWLERENAESRNCVRAYR